MVMRARKVWPGLALVITVTGVLLVALSVPVLSSRAVAHEVVVFGEGPVVLGPYHLEAGAYAVWIEDYFPGFDDAEMFGVVAVRDDGDLDTPWSWGDYVTRRIDGVDCEHAAGWDDLPEDDWTFEISVFGNATDDDPIHVCIARE